MDSIVIQIRNRRALLLSDSVIVCGNSDYTIEFDFDAEWDEYEGKTARFVYCDRLGAHHWIDAPITNGVCHVPVIRDVDHVCIGVYAGDVRTTATARIPYLRCITDFPSAPYIPPHDIYNGIMDAVQNILHPEAGGDDNA